MGFLDTHGRIAIESDARRDAPLEFLVDDGDPAEFAVKLLGVEVEFLFVSLDQAESDKDVSESVPGAFGETEIVPQAPALIWPGENLKNELPFDIALFSSPPQRFALGVFQLSAAAIQLIWRDPHADWIAGTGYEVVVLFISLLRAGGRLLSRR